MTPQEWLTLIEQSAPRLRSAGVATVEISGGRMAISLLPLEPATAPTAAAAAAETKDPEPPGDPDPLDDPATFGGEIAGYTLDEDSQ